LSRARSVQVTLLTVAALAASGAVPAAAAPTPICAIAWDLVLDKATGLSLRDGCITLGAADWRPEGRTKAGAFVYGTGASAERAAGAWDSAAGAGSATASGDALRFDAITPGANAGRKPFELSKLGLELAGGRVYVSGQIRRVKVMAAAAPARTRLAVIAHPKLLSGPLRTDAGKPIADTFIFAVQGRATVTKAFAAAIRRARCATRFARRHPLHDGATLGVLTAQLLSSAATGLGGRVDIDRGLDLLADDGSQIPVAPSGGATSAVIGDTPTLRFPIAPPTAAPLICEFGGHCRPALGAAIALGGQLTLSYAGRATVLSSLVATYAPDEETPTVTARLDGVPVTVYDPAATPPTPDDFLARVSAALGTGVTGDLGRVRATFTSTGPL
jgi:hypothetical protein